MSGINDVVGVWDLKLSDGHHIVEFEHGTTTGKRVIRLDGREVFRKDWMFKLVGKESFMIGKKKCDIIIEAVSGFAYEYSLEVAGKSLKKFTENASKIMKTWTATVEGKGCRIVLEKDTLDIWVNGQRIENAPGEFVDDGTETHFAIEGHSACIKATSSGKRKEGILHNLILDGNLIPEAKE